MFLKSLEIRGFKSFADKTELNFKKGVTTVVGPNGSGKSNISDAVRWVLGEQSVKTLRGGKMEDVIFAGTQYRKPVGLAQVSLILDNSDGELPIDYSDVIITRRIFRSGDSEYLINNSQCRLKDITSLFMDTGIGKEGYSLIGQGKIEAILSGKPEERRALLEEASGIVKFKTRKDEAERKLDNTQQNLVRINDIISTYEERLEPLKVENEKAKVFLELSKELIGKETSLYVYFIKKIEKVIEEQSGKIYKLLNEKEVLDKELLDEKNNLRQIERRLEDIESSSSEERVVYYKSKEECAELQANIELLKERINNLQVSIDNNRSEIEELNSKVLCLDNSRSNLQKELVEKNILQTKLNENVVNLEIKTEELIKSIASQESELQALKDEELQNTKKISEFNNNRSLLLNQLKNLNDSIDQIKENCVNNENSLKINLSTKLILEEKISSIKLEIENIEDIIKSNKKQISEKLAKIVKNEQQLRDLLESANKLEANQNILTNLEKQYEGYNKSVKLLMEHIHKKLVHVDDTDCQVLGEVISVEKTCETAIEIALGSSISNIITKDEDTAKELISYLKEKRLGRATFLPLSIIKGKRLSIDSNVTAVDGFIGIASDVVKYDNRFDNAIKYVLGRTIICKDMNSALNVARVSNYSYKVVTLDGEVVNPGGALTGGSIYNKGTNIISRKREIDELGIKLENTKNSISNINIIIENDKKEVKILDEENLNLRDEIHYKNVEVAKIENEISNIDKDTIKLRSNIKTAQNELILNQSKIEKYDNEINDKNNEIKNLEALNLSYRQKILNIDIEIKNVSSKIIENKEEITEKKITKAQIDEVVSNKISEISRIEREILELNKKVEALNTLIDESINNRVVWQNKIEEDKVKIDILINTIAELENKATNSEIIRVKLKDDLKVLDGRIESLTFEIRKKEEEIHRNDIIKTKQEVEKQNYYNKLNDELNLTYAEALDLATEIENISKYTGDISKIKVEISKLGTVNVSAIEEYKELSKKYTFMSNERDDLEKAKEELLGVIMEMTSKMKEVFKENFIVLNKNFNETFIELFKGGSAELILSEGDELTSNIDINVQPPGKKLQNINLMSGGEKVLSAIALLFAILKMKPTPFCILDEIEAALDDANVYRYAEFLKKFSEKIQFIVITHRKGTMEASDIMYGITMQEKGISKVVSVDLTT
ncbi:chromosome partition protein Smc [Clostridium polyendosporum]|uniref:Chromosome partition protein Smc n=1 Tax=Clostridium polyendosporum TaxID=69208 RepID=A0A919RX09_9CLOT|nr:chromosome segregation protein SMC [Clostridium polyendosporum]GIM27832.1 chromosome partition protein Smc [Clostridium polyendosporum]